MIYDDPMSEWGVNEGMELVTHLVSDHDIIEYDKSKHYYKMSFELRFWMIIKSYLNNDTEGGETEVKLAHSLEEAKKIQAQLTKIRKRK